MNPINNMSEMKNTLDVKQETSTYPVSSYEEDVKKYETNPENQPLFKASSEMHNLFDPSNLANETLAENLSGIDTAICPECDPECDPNYDLEIRYPICIMDDLDFRKLFPEFPSEDELVELIASMNETFNSNK